MGGGGCRERKAGRGEGEGDGRWEHLVKILTHHRLAIELHLEVHLQVDPRAMDDLDGRIATARDTLTCGRRVEGREVLQVLVEDLEHSSRMVGSRMRVRVKQLSVVRGQGEG